MWDQELLPEITRVHLENSTSVGPGRHGSNSTRRHRGGTEPGSPAYGLCRPRWGEAEQFNRTTITDGTVDRPSDPADRQFAATGPNQRVEQGR